MTKAAKAMGMPLGGVAYPFDEAVE